MEYRHRHRKDGNKDLMLPDIYDKYNQFEGPGQGGDNYQRRGSLMGKQYDYGSAERGQEDFQGLHFGARQASIQH